MRTYEFLLYRTKFLPDMKKPTTQVVGFFVVNKLNFRWALVKNVKWITKNLYFNFTYKIYFIQILPFQKNPLPFLVVPIILKLAVFFIVQLNLGGLK